MNKKICIAGASGLVGSELMPRLREYDTIAIMRSGKEIPGVKTVTCDFEKGDFRDVAAAAGGSEILIDLVAAIPGTLQVQDEYSEIDRLMNINAISHIDFLRSLPHIKHVILASTIDVYGSLTTGAYREDHPTLPITYYGLSKLLLEHIFRIYCAAHDIKFTTLRFSQIYGIGEKRIKAIPLFIDAVATGKTLRLVQGGRAVRRYLYASDAAEAIMKALSAGREGVYNIAGPDSRTVRETLQCIERVMEKNCRIEEVSGEASAMDMDSSKAAAEIGFVPQISLEEGIRRVVAEL